MNGSTGISAGYATDIPPHNLTEIIEAVIKRLDNPLCTTDDIMKIVKGPDFLQVGLFKGLMVFEKLIKLEKDALSFVLKQKLKIFVAVENKLRFMKFHMK